MVKRELYLQWDSTEACQLNCIHCYHAHESNETHLPNDNEMGFLEVITMLDDLGDTANKWGMIPKLRISGGEPLLRDRLFDILDYVNEKDIPCGLLTNGLLISKKIARDLKKRGVDRIQVSLDGKKERHNIIRRNPLAYDGALEGIRNAAREGIEVTASMTALKSNYHEFEDVIINSIGAGAKRVGFQSYVPNSKMGIFDPEYLGPRETLDLFRRTEIFVKKYSSEIHVLRSEVLWQIMQRDNVLKQESRDAMKYLGGCSAGYFALSVLSDGEVYPCRRLPISIGNIGEGIVNLITKNKVMEKLRDLKQMGENACCENVTHCRGCRAVAYATTGDYMARDPMCFKDLK
jgi:AdoMet-dependent heme synthase